MFQSNFIPLVCWDTVSKPLILPVSIGTPVGQTRQIEQARESRSPKNPWFVNCPQKRGYWWNLYPFVPKIISFFFFKLTKRTAYCQQYLERAKTKSRIDFVFNAGFTTKTSSPLTLLPLRIFIRYKAIYRSVEFIVPPIWLPHSTDATVNPELGNIIRRCRNLNFDLWQSQGYSWVCLSTRRGEPDKRY